MSETIRKIILQARQTLDDSGIEDAAFNADLMAASILGTERGRLALRWNDIAGEEFVAGMQAMVLRRIRHEPLQYILGEWGFLDLNVRVQSGALIPRPETEEVFLAGAAAIRRQDYAGSFVFADIGTGSGILGLAMIRHFPGACGWLVDISKEALAVARLNIAAANCTDRVALLRASLLSSFSPGSVHVIISNPPYIGSDEIDGLMPEVAEHEPRMALDGGKIGTELIYSLMDQAADVLVPEGLLIFEHGDGQRRSILDYIDDHWHNVVTGDDMCGRQRFFIMQRRRS
jgi:release factor glutamine methyltransferase